MPLDSTQCIIHCSRVNEAVAEEQPNSSGNQSTSACMYMHDITSQTLKLITLKMVAKYVCVCFLNQWQHFD